MSEFELDEELGRGNYGAVKKVLHKPTNVMMAMKVRSSYHLSDELRLFPNLAMALHLTLILSLLIPLSLPACRKSAWN